MRRKNLLGMLLVLISFFLLACNRVTELSETIGQGIEEQDTQEYLEQIKEMYERAKETGEQVPEDVMEWAKADVKRIGTWQYQILDVSTVSSEVMLVQLEELGAARWECFWVEQTAAGKRFYMKKRVRSYVQMAGKATKFIPVPGVGE